MGYQKHMSFKRSNNPNFRIIQLKEFDDEDKLLCTFLLCILRIIYMLGAKHGFACIALHKSWIRTLRRQSMDCALMVYAYISIAHAIYNYSPKVGMRCVFRARIYMACINRLAS